jgi:hypothetical protein
VRKLEEDGQNLNKNKNKNKNTPAVMHAHAAMLLPIDFHLLPGTHLPRN